MKRLFVLLGTVMLVSALAMPLLAHGPGFTRGPHMMGPWGTDSGYCGQHERGYGNLTEEQRSTLQELDRKFYNETATLRNEIMAMSDELNNLLNSADPDPEKAKTLQKSLSELRAKMDEKRLSYTLETSKIIPEFRSRHRYGWGSATIREATVQVCMVQRVAGDNQRHGGERCVAPLIVALCVLFLIH